MIEPNCHFKVICQRGRFDDRKDTRQSIWLLSNTRQALEAKAETFKEYTARVDKLAEIGEVIIKEISQNSELIAEGYHFSLALHHLLPRTLRQLMGEHTLVKLNSDSNGMSLVAAGIFPGVQVLQTPLTSPFINCMEKVFSEPKAGDIIFLKLTPSETASFVYIDADLSFASGDALNLVPTHDILKKWGLPENALKETHQNILIYRKIEQWQCPEEMMDRLIDFYSFAYFGLNYTVKTDRDHDRAGNLWRSLRESASRAYSDPKVDEKVKACWNALMSRCTRALPASLEITK